MCTWVRFELWRSISSIQLCDSIGANRIATCCQTQTAGSIRGNGSDPTSIATDSIVTTPCVLYGTAQCEENTVKKNLHFDCFLSIHDFSCGSQICKTLLHMATVESDNFLQDKISSRCAAAILKFSDINHSGCDKGNVNLGGGGWVEAVR